MGKANAQTAHLFFASAQKPLTLELKKIENQLSTLPKEIGELKELTSLNLEDNPFSKEEKENIEKWLQNCKIVWQKTA